MRRLAILAGLLAALLLVGAGAALYVVERFRGPGPLSADTVVYIARGTSLVGIGERLEDAGVIEDALVFRLAVRLLGATRRLKAGEFLFPAAVSMRGVIDVLLSGKTVVRRLTLPEGVTSAEAAALIEAAEGLEGKLAAVPAEGSLLPETYHYERGDTREQLVARMQVALRVVLDELWSQRAPNLPLESPEEALTLASIVEKETAVTEERPLVASVFINRLRSGMRLQSDPTVVYALTGGNGPLGRALTRQDLDLPSAYNTYLVNGLPPGPIANPGRASLEAVLDPAQSEYLYFVADGSGGHAFAKTLEEHNRNVAKWRKINEDTN